MRDATRGGAVATVAPPETDAATTPAAEAPDPAPPADEPDPTMDESFSNLQVTPQAESR